MTPLPDLPRRPIRLRLPAQLMPLRLILAVVFLFSGALGFSLLLLPGVLEDLRLEGQVEAPAPGSARVSQNRCRFRLLIYACTVQIEHRVDGEPRTSMQLLFFIELPLQSYPTRVLQAGADSSRVTTDLAQDMLGSRIATLAVLVGLFGGSAVFAAAHWFLRESAGRRFRHLLGAELELRPVKIFGFASLGWLGATWYYGPVESSVPISEARFPYGFEPLFLDADKRVALALSSGQGEPLLLDERLKTLKLERTERQRMTAWRAARRSADTQVLAIDRCDMSSPDRS